MKKVVRLTESDLVKLIKKFVNETTMEPEPVRWGEEKIIAVHFDEGETSLDSRSTNYLMGYLESALDSSILTMKRFLDSTKYKIPTVVTIYVQTSSTGSGDENANVAQKRLDYLKNIYLRTMTERFGVRKDVAIQLMAQNKTMYRPYKVDRNFFVGKNPQTVPDEKDRVCYIVVTPIATRGLENNQLISASGDIQQPITYTTRQIKNPQSWWEELLGFDPTYTKKTERHVDENTIVKGIMSLQSYSDVSDVNKIIRASKKMNLDDWINKSVTDPRKKADIAVHLKQIIGSRPGASQYQVVFDKNANLTLQGFW